MFRKTRFIKNLHRNLLVLEETICLGNLLLLFCKASAQGHLVFFLSIELISIKRIKINSDCNNKNK